MNERIKELNLQAMSIVMNGNDPDRDVDKMYVPSEFTKKFAELIVRECAGLFVDQKYMILNPHEPFADKRVRALKEHDRDTVRKIKQHFGVEE
jgi:hypothetical protein